MARPTPAVMTPPAAPTAITVAAPPPPLASHSAPTPSAVALPEPPPWLPPTAFAAINAASAALSSAFDSQASPAPATPGPVAPPPSVSPPTGTTSPRTLLDLFPPAASRESTAPDRQSRESVAVPPPIAAVEPPRVAVKPRAFASPTPARVTTYETFYGL
ncbi:MAG TPA: hypothetical protein VN628_04020, partial [Vicinamibacterales bacterium]|nr:hypothetical protein [Vicinamibacterales bacterium]